MPSQFLLKCTSTRMAPPRKRQKTSNMVNKDTNTGPTRPSGDRPVRHTKSRFSRPRQPSANTSVNNNIIDENSQNDQSNTVLNIDYAKLAAEVLRQQNSNQSVQLDTRDNVADNSNDSVTQSNTPLPYSAVQNSQQTHALATENRQNDTVSAQLLPPLSTLPLNGEHAINDMNSSSLTNIPVHQSPASTVQPSSSVQNNMHSLIDQLLMSQPVSLNSESPHYSSLAGSIQNNNTTSPLQHLKPQAQILLHFALSKSSRKSYHHSWQLFFQLCDPTPPQLPLSISNVCNFVAVLFERSYSPSTILSHVSALSYVHKILNVFDPTSSFLVRKMIKGCENLHTNKESRLPITKDILAKLLNSLDICIADYNVRILLGAVFLLAFSAFLRLGEILVRSSQDQNTVVQVQDVEIFYDNGKPVNLVITLRHYKTIKHNRPITISLAANTQQPQFFPVTAMQKYLSIFKPQPGPLFQFIQGTPVTNKFISDKLSFILRFLGIDTQFYKGHSFRIGAATHAANLGFSEPYIRKLGRWNSSAVNRYIRINAFKL